MHEVCSIEIMFFFATSSMLLLTLLFHEFSIYYVDKMSTPLDISILYSFLHLILGNHLI